MNGPNSNAFLTHHSSGGLFADVEGKTMLLGHCLVILKKPILSLLQFYKAHFL